MSPRTGGLSIQVFSNGFLNPVTGDGFRQS
jgi:hypothetical protein